MSRSSVFIYTLHSRAKVKESFAASCVFMLHIQCYLSLSHRGHKSIGATHISDLHLRRRLKSFVSHLLIKVSQPFFPALFRQVKQKLFWEIFTPLKKTMWVHFLFLFFFYLSAALICHVVLTHPPTDSLNCCPALCPSFPQADPHMHARPSSLLFCSVTSLAPGRCTGCSLLPVDRETNW